MDVGLNNRNTLGDIDPSLADIVFMVEATSTEYHDLWLNWSKQSPNNIEPLDDKIVELILPSSIMTSVKELNQKIKNAKHTRVNWEQISSGFMVTIGQIKKMPVCIRFRFAFINGKKICFYECTSRMADRTMIEDWLISRFQLTNDNYTRWNHVDAMNFHNCVNSLDDLDKKPRNTKYKKS